MRYFRRKQHGLIREKLAKSYADKKKAGFWTAVRHLRRLPSSQASVVDNSSDPSEIATLFASNIHDMLNIHPSTSLDSMLTSIKS